MLMLFYLTVAVDLETDMGGIYSGHIIELGVFAGEGMPALSQRWQIPGALPSRATELTGIRSADLAGMPPVSQLPQVLTAYLQQLHHATGQEIVLVGHNLVAFDIPSLLLEYHRQRRCMLAEFSTVGVVAVIGAQLHAFTMCCNCACV